MADFLSSSGYRIRTVRLLLECGHPEWLKENQKRYHELQQFYHETLIRHPELHELGSQILMRELEKLTVVSKNNSEPELPLPWEKIPAYFRRAAINGEIAALKSTLSQKKKNTPDLIIDCEEKESKDCDKLRTSKWSAAKNSVVFYQRMYRDFTDRKITLHIWNGAEWVWEECRLHGNQLPDLSEEGIKCLSPSVVLGGKHNFLHVPVKEPVYDIRKLKQRMADACNICAVQFMNRDAFAVACILDAEGSQLAVRYFKGGDQYCAGSRRWLNHIEKSRQSFGSQGQPKAEQKYWMHLKHLNEYWAHKTSRDLLNFAKANETKVLTWEEYEPNYSKAVLKKAGNWSPLHLSSRIKEYLSYKAWGEGIVIAPVKTFQIKDRAFTSGDKDLQRARIVGKQFLNNFVKRV